MYSEKPEVAIMMPLNVYEAQVIQYNFAKKNNCHIPPIGRHFAKLIVGKLPLCDVTPPRCLCKG